LDEAVKALGPQSRGITDASKLDELDVHFAQIKRSIGMNWTNVSKGLSI
jgi:hypothetical protein